MSRTDDGLRVSDATEDYVFTPAQVIAAIQGTGSPAALAAETAARIAGDAQSVGGVLSGNLPNPSFAVDMATQAELDSATGVNVVNYGADMTGVSDSAGAVNAAIAAAVASGKRRIYVPEGTLLAASGFTALSQAGMRFTGAGRGATTINCTNSTADLLIISADTCLVEDLTLHYTGGSTPSAGSGIKLSSGTFTNINRVNVNAFYDNIVAVDAYGWTAIACRILNAIRYGAYIRDTASPDTGDQGFIKCAWDTSTTSSAAIRQESGGGLKVVAPNIQKHAIGIDLAVADGVATSNLFVIGGNIENQTANGIMLRRSGTTGTFSRVNIQGLEFLGTATSEAITIDAGISDVTIVGNNFAGNAAQKAIHLIAAAGTNIHSNQFTGYGIGIANDARTRTYIGPNRYRVAIPVQDNLARNLALDPVTHDYRMMAQAITDNVGWTSAWQVDLNSQTGAGLELVVEGTSSGAGFCGRKITKTIHRTTGAITVTADTDVAFGGAVDVNFDTAAVSGSVIVQLRRNAGTSFSGSLQLRLRGQVYQVNVPQTTGAGTIS